MATKKLSQLTSLAVSAIQDTFWFLLGETGQSYKVTVADIKDTVRRLDLLERTADFTLDASYQGKVVEITGAGDVDITVPLEASDDLGDGFVVYIRVWGSGTVTVVGSPTISVPASGTAVIPQDSLVCIYKSGTAADTWAIAGPTVPA